LRRRERAQVVSRHAGATEPPERAVDDRRHRRARRRIVEVPELVCVEVRQRLARREPRRVRRRERDVRGQLAQRPRLKPGPSLDVVRLVVALALALVRPS
jgi:hypothetical protein